MKTTVGLRRAVQDAVGVLKIESIRYFEYRKTYEGGDERHGFWEICCVDRGTVLACCDGEERRMNDGDVILFAPDQPHRMRTDSERPAHVFSMTFSARPQALEGYAGRIVGLSAAQRDVFRDMMGLCREAFSLPMQDDILEERMDAPLGAQQMVRIRLEELLIGVMRSCGAAQSSFGEREQFESCIAEQILEVLRASLYSPLTIEDVSAKLGYSRAYLSGIFGRVHGAGIIHYHAKLRIEEAKRLMLESGMSVTEIARRMGYGSPQHFSRRFAQIEGVSPREFIRSVRQK